MGLAALLLAVCVLYSWQTGSSAVTTVFVQKGKDLHLDVNKPVDIPEFGEFRWKVNDTLSIVRLSPDNKTRIVDPYKGRVEFSVQNHSLLLKNVQHSDSGDYTALITEDKIQLLIEYKVIIQDPVSPVNLSVNSVSNSRESCNLTVTCSTEDALINTFTCDNQTCHKEGGEQSEVTTFGSSLHVYLFNDSIICNHSNQVSWTSDMKEIRSLCSLNADETERTGTNLLIKETTAEIGDTSTDISLNQRLNENVTEDASGPSPTTSGSVPAQYENINTPEPETVPLVTEDPKSDHQLELKNTDDDDDDDDDSVHSQE
ncbi:uncharacterized protein LOC128369704 [Scomber japonicus]|uniref:uncharacterized protein LOC128369704 n=1 Tax=Scomber japonicus TaxID=13676 RepID=UPI002306A3A7|nr:uncharacterized protein LOC128369704 [Scomber japonicus]